MVSCFVWRVLRWVPSASATASQVASRDTPCEACCRPRAGLVTRRDPHGFAVQVFPKAKIRSANASAGAVGMSERQLAAPKDLSEGSLRQLAALGGLSEAFRGSWLPWEIA